MHSNPDGRVALLACLLMASCATVAPKPGVKVLPPAELLQPCVANEPPLTDNGSMAFAIRELRTALGLCNGDKAALREWAEGKP